MTSRIGSGMGPPTIASRWRAALNRVYALAGGRYWFPHVPLAILLGLGGVILLGGAPVRTGVVSRRRSRPANCRSRRACCRNC